MYLLKIKCSPSVPVRSQGPKTQVQTLDPVESQEKDSELGQKVGKIWEPAELCGKESLIKDKQLLESDGKNLRKGSQRRPLLMKQAMAGFLSKSSVQRSVKA